MKLTRKKAIEISISLWTWLAESGSGNKRDWNGWNKYWDMVNHCPLCELREQHRGNKEKLYPTGHCPECPYYKKYGCCYDPSEKTTPIYEQWEQANTIEDRKLYAHQFLEQLKSL